MIDQKLTNSLITEQQVIQDQQHIENHIKSGQYLKSSVYGGLDGIINTLTVIIGGIASGAHPSAILAVGISVLIGDGLGMGLGDYLSAKSEKQFIKCQYKRELWQIQNKFEDEKQQVKQIYSQNGYTEIQSQRIAELYSTNSIAFANIMMLQQLGLVINDSSPLIGGLVTFASFIIFGLLPLIPYIIGTSISKDSSNQYLIYCLIIGGIELFSLGFSKAILIGLNRIKSGLQTLILGSCAVAVGYGVGLAFKIS